jgi:hypothetical protein
MQSILDKSVRPSRFRARRFSFPALALGLCALTCLAQQAALGQAQLGSAETSFDEGPDKLPAVPSASIPPLRAAVPVEIAQLVLPAHRRAASQATSQARPAHMLTQDSRAKNGPLFKKHPPEGTLTAAR